MKIAINVNGAPGSSSAPASALRLARALVDAGHQVERVFFMSDGVLIANAMAVDPDHQALRRGWAELATRAGIELAVCISTALRYGIVDEGGRARHDLPAVTLDSAFTLVGLGQMVDSVSRSDRVVTFAR